ncbi:MAG: histidine kinase [Bacteroidota bacterium]
MEYDNDRIVKPFDKTELYCWILFVLVQPLANSLGIFPGQEIIWIALLTINLLVFPLYLLYSKVLVPKFLFRKQYLVFGLLTLLFAVFIHCLLLLFYKVVTAIFGEGTPGYFSYSTFTIARESGWVVINSILAVAIAYLRQNLQERDIIDSLKKENTFYKVRYFRTQLNPHFLFNTLNSIYSLSLNKTDKTPEVVIRLADIMRFLIYECNEEKIPLDKEIEFIRNYIEIERIRYDADIQFSVEGNTDGIMIEPFLFIAFIENGFKHAIDTSYAKPFIYIKLKVASEQITMNVINNTSLELEDQAKNIHGKGLVNSRSVLDLLYQDAYELDIIQTEKADRAESRMRLKNAQERLHRLYPESHTLDVILNNNTFTVSLILTNKSIDKLHYSRR